MPKIDPVEHEARLALHRDGLNDGEIGRARGVSRKAVVTWRTTHGLKANARRGSAPNHHSMLLYQLGWSDSRIAREQRRDPRRIQRWRARLNLPANYQPGEHERGRGSAMDDLFRRVRRAVNQYMPRDIIDDTVSELCMAVLDGTIPLADIEKRARKYGSAALTTYANAFRTRSLDMKIGDDDFTLMDTLVDHSASSWLEEMGATVW